MSRLGSTALGYLMVATNYFRTLHISLAKGNKHSAWLTASSRTHSGQTLSMLAYRTETFPYSSIISFTALPLAFFSSSNISKSKACRNISNDFIANVWIATSASFKNRINSATSRVRMHFWMIPIIFFTFYLSQLVGICYQDYEQEFSRIERESRIMRTPSIVRWHCRLDSLEMLTSNSLKIMYFSFCPLPYQTWFCMIRLVTALIEMFHWQRTHSKCAVWWRVGLIPIPSTWYCEYFNLILVHLKKISVALIAGTGNFTISSSNIPI